MTFARFVLLLMLFISMHANEEFLDCAAMA